MADGLRSEMEQIEQVLRSYEADIGKLQSKLREARARQNAIAARIESAVARAKAREVMHGSRTLRMRSPSSRCSSAAQISPKAARKRWG